MSLTSTMVQLAHWLQPKETVISHFTIQQWVPKVWTSEIFIWGKHLTRVFGHPQTLICYWKVENQQLGNPTSNFDIQRFLMIFPWKSLEDIYIYTYKVTFKFLLGSCDGPRLIMQHPSTYANHRYWNTIIYDSKSTVPPVWLSPHSVDQGEGSWCYVWGHWSMRCPL